MWAQDSLTQGGLPIGLAHEVKLRCDVPAGHPVRWSDVETTAATEVLQMRQAMEQAHGAG